MEERNYESALNALGTLISSLKRSDGSKWEDAFRAMHTFLERLQLTGALKSLKVIHVAGTKGKGSTCCMTESILRAAGYRTGLFTSPHLCDVRERIRINGRPVAEDIFLRHFWDCFLTFKQSSSEAAGMPAYFRFLTLLSLKVFIEEKVDVAILEVGLGGRLDATNIVPQPVVCGVSSLGFDHMELLGHTLTEIATEKAGIFKAGSPALTSPQEPEAQQALQARATKLGVSLSTVPALNAFTTSSKQRPIVGLAGRHQEINAALAVALAAAFEATETTQQARDNVASFAQHILPDDYARGLQSASWPGRCQVVSETVETGSSPSQLAFYLDGAHTQESMAACGEWFAAAILAEDGLPAVTGTDGDAPSRSQASAQVRGDSAGVTSANGHSAAENGGGKLQPRLEDSSSLVAGQNGVMPARTDAAELASANGQNGVSVDRLTHNLLIFNCQQDREPERLFQPLLRVLGRQGPTGIHHALFVPPDSLYSKPSASSGGGEERDLRWQHRLRDTWETSLPALPAAAKLQGTPLPLPLLPGSRLVEQDTRKGAVLPSLRTTVTWLHSCAQKTSGIRIRVLVTGSLYLVGDMLRQLGQEI